MGAIRQAIDEALDYGWPVTSGLAAWLHCITGLDHLSRLLRREPSPEYEPDLIA